MNTTTGIRRGTEGTALISGELVFATVRVLSEQGESLLNGGNSVSRLDLQAVTRVDSSGLALLLEWQSRAKASGSCLAIENAPADLARLARLCEAEEMLQLANSHSK